MSQINIDNLIKNSAYRIELYSFSNGAYIKKYGITTIKFPAFLTDFTDSFKSSWGEETVMGKMDPIVTFKNTTRNVSLSFDVPNDSLETAREMMNKIDFLVRGLYPVYDQGKLGTAVMVSPPMFRVRFSNLVRNSGQTERGQTLKNGLLCYMRNFDFKPAIDSGFFVHGESLYPKLIKVNLALSIIHEVPLGNYKNGDLVEPRINFESFPHKRPTNQTKTSSKTSSNAVTKQPTDLRGQAQQEISLEEVCGGGHAQRGIVSKDDK